MATDESRLIELAETVADLPTAAKTERPEDRAHLCLVCFTRIWTPDIEGHAAWHIANGHERSIEVDPADPEP